MPNGVTASPATFSLSIDGTSTQTVALTATPSAPVGAATLTVQAVSGSLSHSAQIAIMTEAAVSGARSPLRTRYLRTNGYYDPGFIEQHMTVYDAVHQQFFVSNPYMNEIDVFDANMETQTGAIAVSSPWGIDISPLNGMMYAGTILGDVYEINTSTLQIIQRFPAASIGPSGYVATAALVLSDGRLALQGSIAGLLLDGYVGAAVWDPVTNDLDTGDYVGTQNSICPNGARDLILTGDRTKMVLHVSGSDYNNPALMCTYDPLAKQAFSWTVPAGVNLTFPAPTGTLIYAMNDWGVYAIDASTGQIVIENVGPYTDSIGQLSFASGVSSLDGTTLYLTNSEYASAGGFPVVTLNAQSLQISGFVPSFQSSEAEATPVAGAISGSGLMVGPVGSGVGFVDTTAAVQSTYSLLRAGPATPSSSSDDVQTSISGFATGSPLNGATISEVYVGNLPAANAAFDSASPATAGAVSATTPISGISGAVDLTTVLSDGAIAIDPEGFSYGPQVLQVLNNAAPADGGESAYLVGYGLGGESGKQGTVSYTVSVGNNPSPYVTAEAGPPIDPYDFNTDELMFTVPAGTAGAAADINILSAAGKVTVPGGFHYLPPVEKFPLSDALQGGIYDATRQKYYFTGQSVIEVLSTSGWQAPISLPGTTSSSLLVGVAESPDGSKMAVSDENGQAIYLLNPDNPASVVEFPMPSGTLAGFPNPGKPTGIAVTNDGRVYFVATNSTTAALHCWNSATGVLTDIGGVNPGIAGNYFHIFLSPNGNELYANVQGIVFVLDLASGAITPSFSLSAAAPGVQTVISPEFSMSEDGSTFEVMGSFADSSLNLFMRPQYKDWEMWYLSTLNGLKLNRDGTILFGPLSNGIDLLARNTGRLLYRVGLPDALSTSSPDPLVLGAGTNVVAVITGSGVDIVDMSSLPIPASVSAAFPALR